MEKIMNQELIKLIMQDMLKSLDNEQLKKLQESLGHHLSGVQMNKTINIQNDYKNENQHLLSLYFAAKRTEGCSEKSLKYYESTIEMLITSQNKSVRKVSTDDLRNYLITYQRDKGSSKVTIDNIRRIFSSFFSWLEDEDYIIKSPVRRIHKIKTSTVIKETYSDETLEALRDNCDNCRDLALIDILASTGMRVGELVLLNRQDINFQERECVVFGKGNKERIAYFDARTKLHLKRYLVEREDGEEALFVSLNNPHGRLTIGGVESRLKTLGLRIGDSKIHPHKFRRTLATTAIDKGMPIEQLQRLLGHKRIDTTLHYAMVKQQNVKLAHRKYIG
jgi:site-specific recombinase XerD